jgi:hypothetical protein
MELLCTAEVLWDAKAHYAGVTGIEPLYTSDLGGTMSWTDTEAQERFDELLDNVEPEGPQLVRRGEREYWVMTIEQYDRETLSGNKMFVSADEIGNMAERGEDISRFFSGKGKMIRPGELRLTASQDSSKKLR